MGRRQNRHTARVQARPVLQVDGFHVVHPQKQPKPAATFMTRATGKIKQLLTSLSTLTPSPGADAPAEQQQPQPQPQQQPLPARICNDTCQPSTAKSRIAALQTPLARQPGIEALDGKLKAKLRPLKAHPLSRLYSSAFGSRSRATLQSPQIGPAPPTALARQGPIAPARYPSQDGAKDASSLYQPKPTSLPQVLLDDLVEHKLLGQGAFGKVALVTHPSHENVAAKLIKNAEPNCQNGRTELAAIRREVRFLKKQEHPCVVNLLAEVLASPEAKPCGFLMTVAEGGTLKGLQHHLRDCNKTLPPVVLARMMLPLAKGISSLHSQDICHFDIKPHNVLLGRWNLADLLSNKKDAVPEVRVADLGIAMQLDDKGCPPTAVKNRGTVAYMAPELMADTESDGIKDNCKAADVFSLGTCMLTTATQHLPDKGCYQRECEKIMASKAGKGRDAFLNKKYDSWLQLVWPLMHDDPGRRPPIEQVIELLEEFLTLEDTRLQKKLSRSLTVKPIITAAKQLFRRAWFRKKA